MTTKQLKDLLTDIADESTPTALHQRAVAQSRRDTRYRAVLASVTALVVAGAGIFAVTALADRPNEHDRPTDSALPTSDVTELAGTYYQVDGGAGEPEALMGWTVGDEETDFRFDAATDWGRYLSTGRVSPGGRHYSYLTQPSTEGGESGDTDLIKIRDLSSGETTQVGEYDPDESGPCSAPEWAPDGERLFVDKGPGYEEERTGFIDIASGAFTAFEVRNPCDMLVTTDGDGGDVVLTTDDNDGRLEIYATDADGERTRTKVADVLESERSLYATDLVAVSPDGRFVCVETADGPDSYVGGFQGTPYCDTIVDLETEKLIDIPRHNDLWPTGSPSVFAIPGRLVLEADDGAGETVHKLYDFEGELLDEVDSVLDDAQPPIAFVPE